MISVLVVSLILSGTVHSNIYSDPNEESCDAGGGGESDCGCGQLRRDTTKLRDTTGDQYEDGKAARVWGLYMGQSRVTEYETVLVELLRERDVTTVLDAAAGTGVDSTMLLDNGFTVTSVDLSEQMLSQARKVKEKRKSEGKVDDWQIGLGNWLDLENVQETVVHPSGGYDAIICIGNSFAHLPDSTGDQTDHRRAISNFHRLLKPGGILVIDHRNYDYILEHWNIPNSASKLYYRGGDRIHSIRVSHAEEDWITLLYEIDVSGSDLDGTEELRLKSDGESIPVVEFSLSYYPHRLQQFTELLRGVFGELVPHEVLGDFSREDVMDKDSVPSYYVHVIQKDTDI